MSRHGKKKKKSLRRLAVGDESGEEEGGSLRALGAELKGINF